MCSITADWMPKLVVTAKWPVNVSWAQRILA